MSAAAERHANELPGPNEVWIDRQEWYSVRDTAVGAAASIDKHIALCNVNQKQMLTWQKLQTMAILALVALAAADGKIADFLHLFLAAK